MDTPPAITPEDALEDANQTAASLRSGAYFREMQQMYAAMYLDPMSDRYFYLIFTTLCVLIFAFIAYALSSLYPLSQDIPFFYRSDNAINEKPVIRPLQASRKEDLNLAIKRYAVDEYVRRREEYDINTLDMNVRFVKAQSEPTLYNLWQQELDPGNPQSPIAQFQRNYKRVITVTDTTFNQDGTVDVAYDASVENAQEGAGQAAIRVSHMLATLAFQYADVTIDQISGAETPLHFLVTDYRTSRLQE